MLPLGSTPVRRPPAPSDAERARSVVARANVTAVDDGRGSGLGASLVGTGCPPTTPLTHHVWADGSAALLLRDDDPLVVRAAAGTDVMLELADHAPVDLREPVRALVWISGRLTVPDPGKARTIAARVADVRPDPALLDLGHGATLARLAPGSIVISDAEGTAALAPVALAGARPDPFSCYEQRWLAHLEEVHPGVFVALARHLPEALRRAALRPLGVDRHGIRLRVETPARDHDVRLNWEQEVTTPDELRAQLTLLVGCPLRRARTP